MVEVARWYGLARGKPAQRLGALLEIVLQTFRGWWWSAAGPVMPRRFGALPDLIGGFIVFSFFSTANEEVPPLFPPPLGARGYARAYPELFWPCCTRVRPWLPGCPLL